ncbi:MAG: c-type cytochrome [Verrucomicrobiae bacterium]|nr:c-type cytochrome [Verrucomicrobiae bacterium]
MKHLIIVAPLAVAMPAMGDFTDAELKAVTANYTKHCASCHHREGTGKTTMGRKVGAKDFTDPKVIAEFTDEKALKNLKEGVKDRRGTEIKKPFTDKLSEEEMLALIKYTRTFAKK